MRGTSDQAQNLGFQSPASRVEDIPLSDTRHIRACYGLGHEKRRWQTGQLASMSCSSPRVDSSPTAHEMACCMSISSPSCRRRWTHFIRWRVRLSQPFDGVRCDIMHHLDGRGDIKRGPRPAHGPPSEQSRTALLPLADLRAVGKHKPPT